MPPHTPVDRPHASGGNTYEDLYRLNAQTCSVVNTTYIHSFGAKVLLGAAESSKSCLHPMATPTKELDTITAADAGPHATAGIECSTDHLYTA